MRGLCRRNKLLYESDIAFQKIIFEQARRGGPGNFGEVQILNFSPVLRDRIETQIDRWTIAIAGHMASQFHADFGVDAEFFPQFPLQGGTGVFASFHFASGKFPFERVAPAGLAPADEDLAAPLNDCRNHDHQG